jgi:hypothetical protein
MQRIDIGRVSGVDFHGAEAGQDELLPNALIVGRRSRRLAGQMLWGHRLTCPMAAPAYRTKTASIRIMPSVRSLSFHRGLGEFK